MSALNVTDELNAVTARSVLFSRVWCWTMFSIGLFGHSLNLYVFTRATLRCNPCVRYLTASTIAGLAVVFIILPIRLLQMDYRVNLFLTSVTLCKLLTFLLSWIR